MQMYSNFARFPLLEGSVWAGKKMTPCMTGYDWYCSAFCWLSLTLVKVWCDILDWSHSIPNYGS